MHSDIAAALERIARGERAADLETATLDFKEHKRSRDDLLKVIARSAACFANAGGGHVVVGVADRVGGGDAFTGTDLQPDPTRLRIHQLTDPPLLVDVERADTAYGTVVVISAPRGLQVHIADGKIPTERVGTSCEPMSSDRIAVVTDERRGRDWSDEDSDVPPEACDPLALENARKLLAQLPDSTRRSYATATDIALLRALGVVTETQTLTRGGALLFTAAERPAERIAYTHRRTPAGAITVNEILHGPMLTAILRTFEYIEARNDRTPVSLRGGQQLHVADLPEGALREAVVNAAMHREYRSGSGRITVEHTQTQLAVTSPGGLVSGVRPDNVLTTSSRPRNPKLASALRFLGLAETAGTGVDRMYAEMARVGHQPPIYTATPEHVRVALMGGAPNTALTKYVSTLPNHERDDADAMLVLLTLLTKKTITAAEIAPLLQKPTVEEASAVLLRLATHDVAMLEPTRQSARRAAPVFRLREEALVALGTAVTYRRRTTDQVDRKIVDYVKETGTINGRVTRLLLELDTVQASRVLSDLVDRELLVKTSEATRGPSVTYGPGPKFPAQKKQRRTASRGRDQEPPSEESLFPDIWGA
ncbi:ATP-binding protein [Microbacterium karelineae]|uniref:ATP-binding protein n=1 Tax=Microbacterium karelineae TaxID=2654283 RepID=UPI0012EA76A9|nr:ATP-binding protein [Microbacterium karelineae]